MRSGAKSRAAFTRAKKVIPSGVNSNFRYWGDDQTLVVKNAKGAYIWDQDDVRYIDYRLGFGPVILGHAHSEVLARVKDALEAWRNNKLQLAQEGDACQEHAFHDPSKHAY